MTSSIRARSRSASARSRPRSLGISTETLTSRGDLDLAQHLLGVGQLRDHLGAHERRSPRSAGGRCGRARRSARPSRAVGIVSGSFWKPSRGPTSRMLTLAGRRACRESAAAPARAPHRRMGSSSEAYTRRRVPPKSTDPVAVIGASGALGFGLALRLARTGVPIAIGSRDPDRARETAERAKRARSPRASSRLTTTPAPPARRRRSILSVPFRNQSETLANIARRPARGPAVHRRHRPAGGGRVRQGHADAGRVAGVGRPAGAGDGPRRGARGVRAAHRQRRVAERPRAEPRPGRAGVRRQARRQARGGRS